MERTRKVDLGLLTPVDHRLAVWVEREVSADRVRSGAAAGEEGNGA